MLPSIATARRSNAIAAIAAALQQRAQHLARWAPHLRQLGAEIGLDTVRVQTADDAAAAAQLARAGFAATAGAGGVAVRVPDGDAAVAPIVGALQVAVRNVNVHKPTLDDVFLHFTGHEIRAEAPAGHSPMMRAWGRGRR
ncbi:MAG: hypothetical protein ABR562_08060 [Thermoplasmatota archaeon]